MPSFLNSMGTAKKSYYVSDLYPHRATYRFASLSNQKILDMVLLVLIEQFD